MRPTTKPLFLGGCCRNRPVFPPVLRQGLRQAIATRRSVADGVRGFNPPEMAHAPPPGKAPRSFIRPRGSDMAKKKGTAPKTIESVVIYDEGEHVFHASALRDVMQERESAPMMAEAIERLMLRCGELEPRE